MPSGGQDPRGRGQLAERLASIQACRMTWAAAASTTLRRRAPVTPASRSERSASTVENRSSHRATGTVSIARSTSAKLAACVARARRTPSSETGSPITTRVTSCSRTRSAIARISPGGRPTCTVPSGTARRRSGSLMATPMRTSPRSRPRTRPASERSGTGEEHAGAIRDRGKRRGELRGARAAGVREVVLAAGAAADHRRGIGEQRGCGYATADRGRRRRGHEDRLAVRVPHDDGRRTLLQAVAHLDGQLPELPRVERRHVADDERKPVHLVGLGDELVDHGDAIAGAKLPQLVAEPLVLLDHAARPLDRRARILRVERTDEVAQERPLDVDLAQGLGSDERLDPPQARADRPFTQ